MNTGGVSEISPRARGIEERAHAREPIFGSVREQLGPQNKSDFVQGFGSCIDLVARLLRRAPDAWLKRQEPSHLAQIVRSTFSTLVEWNALAQSKATSASGPSNTASNSTPGLAASSQVIVSGQLGTYPAPGETNKSNDSKDASLLGGFDTVDSIRIALLDRPFIINTIDAVLRAHGRRPAAFLHPILSVGGESVSLSFIQLQPQAASGELPSQSPEKELAELLSDLRQALNHLTLAADDFADMRVAVEHFARMLQVRAGDAPNQDQQHESAEFLNWLLADSLVIEGVATWSVKNSQLSDAPSRKLGFFKGTPRDDSGADDRSKSNLVDRVISEAHSDAQELLQCGESLSVSLLSERSRFHHRGRLCSFHIYVPGRSNTDPQSESEDAPLVLSVIGQLTSKATSEEGSRIPVVRARLRAVLDAEGLRPSSHLYKAALRIIDGTPKHIVLSGDEHALHIQVGLLLEAQQRGERASCVRRDRSGRGVWAVVALPSFEFTSEIRSEIAQAFAFGLGVSSDIPDVFVTSVDEPLCRVYLYAPVVKEPSAEDLAALELILLDRSKGWASALGDILAAAPTLPLTNGAHAREGELRELRFHYAFPEDYQAIHSPAEALDDVALLDTLSEENPLAVKLCSSTSASEETTSISICCFGREITLSRSLPILEHAGFEVLHERAWCVRPLGGPRLFLHRFPVKVRGDRPFPALGAARDVVSAGVQQALLGKCEDDILNSLMTTAGLDIAALSLLRAYCMLLWQVKKFATRQTIREAFASNPSFARQFWEVAKLKFDPSLSLALADRIAQTDKGVADLRSALHAIQDITADRILRALVSLLQLTVRTNFFAKRAAVPLGAALGDKNGSGKEVKSLPGPRPEVVALKIHSEQLELLSHPRPLFEIFVSAPAFEGVHLRGSRVARGGIRWSDRREDFRSEVRDLMRTQQVKNAIIVPSGAKGGFVVKDLPQEREAQANAVKDCYREFIRALLSLTDNRVDNALVPPPGVICHDEPDPYLVVAADKGTASFSDVANTIAVEEFKFWLGDAFASGGSNGYDHKRLGVTARGAWEAVRQHFKDARIDFEKSPFTAVGIGDMSGDVFGNGLLESKNTKLIAAFNHKHIFIDPTPDPAASWNERNRLFNMPFSQWSDYDLTLLSKGGMVVARAAKEIELTKEARIALGLASDTPKILSGEQVVSLILKAPVDMLWNGGIGTYVKSRDESDGDVDDSANDAVRINADELRAKVVSEGGNLGFTQRARIDFAERGGLINTDAIDNSGGVDTSDHEVNLKILLSEVVKNGTLSLEDRNTALRDVSTEVVSYVLSHNRGQAVLISSSAKRGSKNLEYFKSLMNDLARRGYLNRAVHILPSDETLEDRARKGTGLFRPELAMCTAGVKLWVKDELLSSGLTQDPALFPFLSDYFPPQFRGKFDKLIRSHPLAPNIIATRVANELVETVGLTFVHRMCLSHSVDPSLVLRSLLAAHVLLQTPQRKLMIQPFDTFENHERYQQYRIELSAALREATAWLISNHSDSQNTKSKAATADSVTKDSVTKDSATSSTKTGGSVGDLCTAYAVNLQLIFNQPLSVLTGSLRDYVERRVPKYTELGFSENAAHTFAVSPLTPSLFEILWAARRCVAQRGVAQSSVSQKTGALLTETDVKVASSVFCTLIDTLGVYDLLAAQRSISTQSKWEHELLLSSYDDIRRATSLIAVSAMSHGVQDGSQVAAFLQKMPGIERLRLSAREIAEGAPQVAKISVFARLLRTFAE